MRIALTDKECRLVEANVKLIYGALNHYNLYSRFGHLIEKDDMEQIGAIGLCKAVLTYDASKGELSTIAYKTIRNAIYDEARKHKKRAGVTVISFEIEEYQPRSCQKSIDEAIMCTELNSVIERAKQTCSPAMAKGIAAMQLRAAGYRLREIQDILGGGAVIGINANIRKARKKLRQDIDLV